MAYLVNWLIGPCFTTGQTIGIDVIFLRNWNDLLARVSFCSVSYGFFGDLLLRSEKLRKMGPARYLLAGLLSLIRLRSYWVETSINIADVQHSDLTDSCTECEPGCTICKNDTDPKETESRETRSRNTRVTYVQVPKRLFLEQYMEQNTKLSSCDIRIYVYRTNSQQMVFIPSF